jgi:aminoglycoside phosphotransferase (APT) family kinase protein
MPTPCLTGRAVQILAAVRELPGLDAAATPRPVAGGRSHECWRLSAPGGELLVKVPLRDPQPERVARHAAMHQAAYAAGVPVARLLTAVGHSPVLDAPLLVLAWLEGTDADAAWPRLTHAEQATVCQGWGASVAGLHTLRAPTFTGHQAASWAQVVAARSAQLAAEHTAAGLLPDRQVTAARHTLEQVAAKITGLVEPAFTHLALHLRNVLIYQRRFTALLDCEHARWWDPAADLVKLDMWVFDQHPQTRAQFWNGYTAAGGQLPGLPGRLRVCQGMEWLSGLLYWHRVGDHPMYTDYQHRLTAWLAG